MHLLSGLIRRAYETGRSVACTPSSRDRAVSRQSRAICVTFFADFHYTRQDHPRADGPHCVRREAQPLVSPYANCTDTSFPRSLVWTTPTNTFILLQPIDLVDFLSLLNYIIPSRPTDSFPALALHECQKVNQDSGPCPFTFTQLEPRGRSTGCSLESAVSLWLSRPLYFTAKHKPYSPW